MSERLYSLLLRLYPRGFRDGYAEEMARVFRDRLRHERVSQVWLDVLADAVVSIPRQHWLREPHPLYPPSAAPLRGIDGALIQARSASAVAGALFGIVCAVGFLSGVAALVQPVLLLPALGIMSLWAMTLRRAFYAKRMLKAFRAEASATAVTVAYQGAAPVTLQRSEVIGLHDYPLRGLRIRTVNPASDLWVPARTSSYAQMKARLSQWMPLEVTPMISAEAVRTVSLVLLCVFAIALPVRSINFIVLGPLFLFGVIRDVGRGTPVRRQLLPFAGLFIVLARWLG